MRSLERRNIFTAALAAGTAWLAARAAPAIAAADPSLPRVAYHLADPEKVVFVLGNIRNHIAGMGGPDKVRIALVVHGSALKAFRSTTPNAGVKSDVGALHGEGVELHACRNTMEAQKLSLDDLLPGFAVAEKGAVVKLAELQAEGWVYLRP